MRIVIAGDFCPRYRVATLFEKGDYASVLGDVKEIFKTVDYSIVNFECPITNGGEKPITKLGPNLHCSEKGMEAIKWAGFDCVTLANNHFYDFGDQGVANTLLACKKYKIDNVGGGHNLKEASCILYKQINGQILAIINCCEHEFSIATETTAGCNPLNPIQQYYAIKEARKHADYVLVIIHGGHEHFQLPSPRMIETYRFFIDAGADAVVNHHQHCYSGYEVHNGKPIFYGLGNFCFDSNYREGFWTEGYMVIIDFRDSSSEFIIQPYQQCADEACVKLLPTDTFNEKLLSFNAIISDETALCTVVDKYYASCASSSSNIFEPIRNRFYLGAKSRGWLPSFIKGERKLAAANQILCEAHRDKLMYWLEK